MATDADFTGLKGELLYEYYICQEGDDVTRTVTAKEVANWLHEVALQLGKHKLAGEANTYAKRLVEDGFDTVEGIAGLDVGDLTEAGMRKGDAKTLMRNVSEKCTPSGGDDSSINASGHTSSGASGNTTTTEASVAMVESYAIAASRSGAQAAVQAIKATEPVPELKGKVTTVKVTALVEWIKSISKHHSVKGTTLGKVVAAMAKLFDWPADEIADTAWEQAQEDPMMFKIQDVDLLEKVKEGLSNDLWGAIEDSDPDTGTQAIAHLIKVVVHRPHGVVAAKIAAIGQIEAVKWDVGLTSGLTLLLAAIAEVRYSPFYTYDLAFEALVDTLQRFQHIVTKLTMYWVKFSGDPEEDDYRHKQSKYWDKLVVTLWAAVEVAEINGKTKQQSAPRETRTRDKKSKGGKGSGGGKGKGDTDKSDRTCWLFKQGKCTYGKDCKFKHEAGATKGASVRQLSVEALENSTKVTLPMAGHEGEGWSIVRPRRTYKNALYRAARALEAPTRSSAVTYVKGCDTIYRVLEDVTADLGKPRRWATQHSAEKLMGAQDAQGCHVERGLVKIEARNRSYVRRQRSYVATLAVDDANVECGAAAMACHTHPSRRPHVVEAETSGTGSVGLKGETYSHPELGQNSRSGAGQESVPNWDVRRRPEDCAQNGNKTPTSSPRENSGGLIWPRTSSPRENSGGLMVKTKNSSPRENSGGLISRHVRHGGPQVRCGKTPTVVHILRVARVARVNVETRKALRGVARAELGRAGLGGGSRKSRLKAPKFEKWLNGAPPQAELNEAIEALQQLREKRQQSGGEGPSVMRTARTKGAQDTYVCRM